MILPILDGVAIDDAYNPLTVVATIGGSLSFDMTSLTDLDNDDKESPNNPPILPRESTTFETDETEPKTLSRAFETSDNALIS